MLTRAASFAPQTWDAKTREIELVLSTGAAVRRREWDTGEEYDEILSIEPGAVLTDRVDAGAAPLLIDHYPSVGRQIGRLLPGSVRYDAGRLVARAVLTAAEDVASVVQRVIEGIASSVSVGYEPTRTVDERVDGRLVRTVVEWRLFEGSIVAIPADAGAHTRSQEVHMDPVVEIPAVTDEQKRAIAIEESRRQAAIRSLCRRHGVDVDAEPTANDAPGLTAIRAALADPAVGLDAVRASILDVLAARSADTPIRAPHVEFVRDATETEVTGMVAALAIRAALPVTADESSKAVEYRAATWSDVARRCLEIGGVSTRGMSRVQIVQAALHQRSHVTADFPNLTANLMNKSLAAERAVSGDYRWFERLATRTDMPDYKDRTLVDFGGIGTLPVVPEGADYTRCTFGDEKVQWHLVKYGREIALTEELVLNDDLNGFLRLVRMFARAAIVTESSVACTAVSSNPTMGDGYALFDAANHGNYNATGGAPDITRLAAGDTALRNMTDRDGAVVGRPTRYLLLPSTWRTAVEQLYSPQYSPTSATNCVTVPVSPENRIYPPQFTGTPWYMHNGDSLAMEYGYLQGEGGPVVLDYAEERSDARVYHCRDVFAARVVDYRAWYCDAGA